MIHENDRQNLRKHEKMERRAAAGNIHPNCSWGKKTQSCGPTKLTWSSNYVEREDLAIDRTKERNHRCEAEIRSVDKLTRKMSKLGMMKDYVAMLQETRAKLVWRMTRPATLRRVYMRKDRKLFG
jgi:hypothetical protein